MTELETLQKELYEAKLELSDARFEKDLYRKDSRELRRQNESLKQSIEFHNKENQKIFIELCNKLFPNFWRKYPISKDMFCHVVKDWEDGMLGIVIEGFGSSLIKCYMMDDSIRTIDTFKKDWINFLKI